MPATVAASEMPAGHGVLVSAAGVAGVEQKAKLAESYGAQAVDMEAAAVARGAQAQGVGFLAVKAISDESDFHMPALDRFVDETEPISDGKVRDFCGVASVALAAGNPTGQKWCESITGTLR